MTIPVISDAKSWYSIGQGHSRAGNLWDAVAAYSSALACDQYHAKARLGRGLTLQKLGDHELAIRDFSDAIQRFPTWDGLYIAFYGRAFSNSSLGRWTAAVDDCNQVLQHKKDNIDSLYLRATALERLGELEQALADLTTVINMDETYHQAYYSRGTLFYSQGRWEKAIRDFSVFLAHTSQADGIVSSCYRLRGIAAFELGRNQAAVEDLSLAIEANSTDASNYLRRSQAFAAMGEAGSAEADIKKATSLLGAGRGRRC